MNGTSWLVFAGIAAALWCLYSGKGKRTVPGHSHSGNRRHVARHEGGHFVTAKAVGGTVRSAHLSSGSNPHGMVHATVPNAKAEITFLLAGRAAAPGVGCSTDVTLAKKTLREFPRHQRSAVWTECERAARRIVASRGGEIARVADRLDKNGHL